MGIGSQPIRVCSSATILISAENSSTDTSLGSYQQSYPRAIHANRGKLYQVLSFGGAIVKISSIVVERRIVVEVIEQGCAERVRDQDRCELERLGYARLYKFTVNNFAQPIVQTPVHLRRKEICTTTPSNSEFSRQGPNPSGADNNASLRCRRFALSITLMPSPCFSCVGFRRCSWDTGPSHKQFLIANSK